MKITNRGILEIRQALTALDGHPTPTSIENTKASVYLKPYDFTGSIRFRIGRILSTLNVIAQDIEKASDAIAKKYAVDNIIPAPVVAAYTQERNNLLDIENDVEITKLTEVDLKLDINPIPGSVLSVLNAIIA